VTFRRWVRPYGRLRAIFPVAILVAVSLVPGLQASASGADGAASVPPQPSDCCGPSGSDEPKVGGDYGDQDYSSLAAITPANVHDLSGAFFDHLEGGATPLFQESTPVAVDGKLYVQTTQGDVFAVDGARGRVIWEYKPAFSGRATERSVTVADGRVYAALGGEHIVALNQQTGRLDWVVQVGTPGQDVAANGAQTNWTLYYDGLVFTGTQDGGAQGGRGHVYALDAATGTPAWNFATTAAPGQPGGGTWAGDSWRLGGGDAWMAPAIDPRLGLLYLAVGNPEPRTVGTGRAGDDYYTNSLVALNVTTGRLKWWFQSVHHDLWDYDNTMSPVIASLRYGGATRLVVIYGSKTGWLYYLDAGTGQPVIPVHEEAVPTLVAQATSPTQPIPEGDALVPVCPTAGTPSQAIPDYLSGCEFEPYLHQPVLVTPGSAGGANWALMSLDQKNGLLYVAASDIDSAYSDGQPFGQPTFYTPAGERRGGLLDAVDPTTNTIVWQVPTTYGLSAGDGILTTASGLLFEGSPSGVLTARSATTGRVLWTWQTGAGIATTPITYRVGGQQYVAVFAGGHSLPSGSALGDNLWAFKLGGTVPPAATPAQPPVRVPVVAPTVAGSTVENTVVLGRTWDPTTDAPGSTEDLASQTAMAPAIMTVTPGTVVTFANPAGNTKAHCAASFFDPASFRIGPLPPGESGSYRFSIPGDYFFNDCAGFPWDSGEIVVTTGADLAVSVAGPAAASDGASFVERLTVTDNGPSAAAGTVANLLVPTGLTVAAAPGASLDRGTLVWSDGALAPGASVTHAVTFTVGPGVHADTAIGGVAEAAVTDPDVSNNAALTTLQLG
jgi:PQQ-dependent dehydrogenase (methanol/ethanol family)